MELAMSVEFVYKYVCVYDKILCSCHTCTFKGCYMEFQVTKYQILCYASSSRDSDSFKLARLQGLFTESKSFTQDNRLLILGRSQLWHLNMFQKSHNKQQRIGDLEIQTKYKIHWKRYYFHREKKMKNVLCACRKVRWGGLCLSREPS